MFQCLGLSLALKSWLSTFQHYNKIKFCRWVVALLVGIVTGSIAAFIDFCVETGSEWKYTSIKKCILLIVHSGLFHLRSSK